MIINYYFIYFIILSVCGYVYETCAMIVWKGKWEDRGFLYGPVIPIYGVGALIATIVFTNSFSNASMLIVFVVGVIGSALLELPTSIVLEKLFHASWWDYSSAPLNFQGRISLFSSLGFGVGALIIVYIINPFILPILDNISPLALQIMAYICLAIFSADFAITVTVLSNFEKRLYSLEEYIDAKMSEAINTVNPKKRNLKNALVYTKENIIDNIVERSYKQMDFIHHSAIKKIRKFKNTSSDTINELKDKIKIKVGK